MSRYKKEREGLRLNYGWDHALGYWYDVSDLNETDSEGEPKLLEERSYFINRMSRGEFAEKLESFKVRKEHLMSVALDQPF